MKVLDPGHKYELSSLDGTEPQILTFVKRDQPPEKYPGNVGHYPGTTIQEVLRALIDRLHYVDNQMESAESQAARGLLKTAMLLLEIRAKRRHNQTLDVRYHADIDRLDPCAVCGHVLCAEHVVGGSNDYKPAATN